MRALLVAPLLVGVAACDPSRGTRPDGTVIQIRLRDDQARPGGRNAIVVTTPTGSRIDTSTGTDGVADISVPGGGAYHVRVVPRAGYLSSPDLTTTVMVRERETAVIAFVLHLLGKNDDPIEPGG